MRQITVILLVSLLLVATVTAESKLKFGIKAGAVMANMSGDGWDVIEEMDSVTIEKKSLMGVAGGLFVEFPLGTSGVSLQPELLYVAKGGKGETTLDDVTFTRKLKNDYIEVPVLVKYNFTSAGKASPFMFVGPVAAFNIASKVQDKNPPDDPSYGDFDIENAKSLDFGLTIGGGLGLAMGSSGKLTFDLRYTVGLGDAFKDVAEADFDENKTYIVDDAGKALDFKNNDIRLMIGYAF
ncbi:MAG: porin family protein [candidate division Zixibacteria bacterium]|nr:porin family protein [candidate division Zixibacteria bacterium]